MGAINYPKNVVEIPFAVEKFNGPGSLKLPNNVYAYLSVIELGAGNLRAQFLNQSGNNVRTAINSQNYAFSNQRNIGKIKLVPGTQITLDEYSGDQPWTDESGRLFYLDLIPNQDLTIGLTAAGVTESIIIGEVDISESLSPSSGNHGRGSLQWAFNNRSVLLLEKHYLPIDNLPGVLRSAGVESPVKRNQIYTREFNVRTPASSGATDPVPESLKFKALKNAQLYRIDLFARYLGLTSPTGGYLSITPQYTDTTGATKKVVNDGFSLTYTDRANAGDDRYSGGVSGYFTLEDLEVDAEGNGELRVVVAWGNTRSLTCYYALTEVNNADLRS